MIYIYLYIYPNLYLHIKPGTSLLTFTCNSLPNVDCIGWTASNIAHRLYSALSIYCGLFSPNNTREIPIAHPLGPGMGVFCEIIVWPKFYLWIQWTMCSINLYGTVANCPTPHLKIITHGKPYIIQSFPGITVAKGCTLVHASSLVP